MIPLSSLKVNEFMRSPLTVPSLSEINSEPPDEESNFELPVLMQKRKK